MQRRAKAVVAMGLAAMGILALGGCNEMAKFKDRLKLSDAQVVRAQPIVEAYLENQDKIFSDMQTEMSSQRPGEPGGPGGEGLSGMGGFHSGARPDVSEMKTKLNAMRKENEKKFQANDAAAAKELSAFLSADQMAEFPKIAEEIRQAKQKEMMSSGPGGGQGGPGGGPGGGPQGGGMGGPGF
jgi:hypothetical protein